jgi:hypothetical protein
VQEQEVITKDNAVILTNAIAFIKVTDPIKAVYGVTDFSEAIRNMIMTTLRSIIGEMTLDEALVQPRQDQGAPARKHRRRSHRLGAHRQSRSRSRTSILPNRCRRPWKPRLPPSASARPW